MAAVARAGWMRGMAQAAIRIGIDTGGTFTDVVAFDEDDRRAGHHQDAVDPGQPGRRLPGRHRQGARPARPPTRRRRSTAVSHGTTVATNQLLEGKVDRLGFITTEGYEAMLEIARQSVPDGYGNCYFWVKPDRIVPRDLVRGVDGRLDFTGAEVRPFDEDGARARRPLVPRPRHQHPRRLLPARLRQPRRTSSGCARSSPRSTPTRSCRSSSEVLREYREYERAMTTLVDAAVKPRLSRVRRQHQDAGSDGRSGSDRPRRSRST